MITQDLASGLRIHEPSPGVLAFYDGRIEGHRLLGPEANWVDDGAYVLGTASYAIVSGADALVYDTHMSIDHARAVRRHLERLGVNRITVVLSHWHLDHVAGNAVFAECEIIANARTAAILAERTAAIEAGTQSGPPAISPLTPPNRTFKVLLDLRIGAVQVRLLQIDSHSIDGTVLWLPDRRLLLAGDTLEDPITYVAEPERLEAHLLGLDALAELAPERILPNHGDEQVIASGGFGPELIAANRAYVERLLETAARAPPKKVAKLARFIAAEVEAGAVRYFAAYEDVHRRNIAAVRNARQATGH